MVREMPASRRRLNAHGMILRRRRIFSRLREGLSYEEIANEEGVTAERVRQVVSEALQKRSIDSGADHAKLQLDRLVPVMQIAAEAPRPCAARLVGKQQHDSTGSGNL